jgi:McrBC 5-methylcytosine restriction system component
VRLAATGIVVEHGTTSSSRIHLLVPWDGDDAQGRAPAAGLGKLKPDIVVHDGESVAVLDAKYKHLRDRWPARPDGVDRADLYRLAAYLGRLDPHGIGLGMLLYPVDSDQVELSRAEDRGPWQTESGSHVRFERIPVTEEAAVEKLSSLLAVGSRVAQTAGAI